MTMSFNEWMNQPEYIIASDSEKLCEGDVFYAMFGDYAVRGVVSRIHLDVADGDYGLPVRDNNAQVKLDNGMEGYVNMNGDGHTCGTMHGADHSGIDIPFDTVTLTYMRNNVEGWVP